MIRDLTPAMVQAFGPRMSKSLEGREGPKCPWQSPGSKSQSASDSHCPIEDCPRNGFIPFFSTIFSSGEGL